MDKLSRVVYGRLRTYKLETLAMPPPMKPRWNLVLTMLCASLSFVVIMHVAQLLI